jgi:hypothetical protein
MRVALVGTALACGFLLIALSQGRAQTLTAALNYTPRAGVLQGSNHVKPSQRLADISCSKSCTLDSCSRNCPNDKTCRSYCDAGGNAHCDCE